MCYIDRSINRKVLITQCEQLVGFIRMLKEQDSTVADFDEALWGSLVDFVTVGRDRKMIVTFKDGTEILA